MRWASTLATANALPAALEAAAADVAQQLGQVEPDIVFAFVSAQFADAELDRVPALLAPLVGSGLLVGCVASGVLAAGREIEDESAVALLAGVLPGVDLSAALVDTPNLPAVAGSRKPWHELVGFQPEDDPTLLLIADPFTFDAERCARGLDRAFPGAPVIGGLASGAAGPGGTRLYVGGEVLRHGAILLAAAGNLRCDPLVAQGCRPIGEPLFVTSVDGSRIRELDGRRPRDVLADLYDSLPPADQQLVQDSLFLGMALPGPRQSVGAGDFLIRNILGLDADTGVLGVGARVAQNTVVQFHLRDAAASARELNAGLQGIPADGAAAALMFSCVGRGTGLYGASDHDSRMLREHFGPLPIGGCFCAGEIGPVQGVTFVHGYTSAIGILRPRR